MLDNSFENFGLEFVDEVVGVLEKLSARAQSLSLVNELDSHVKFLGANLLECVVLNLHIVDLLSTDRFLEKDSKGIDDCLLGSPLLRLHKLLLQVSLRILFPPKVLGSVRREP